MAKQSEKQGTPAPAPADAAAEKPKCGIVRSISDIETYPVGHWNEVHEILAEAVEEAGYEARLVSENESVGVILGNIVTNLYSDPIVICDVSSRNPNVMFELGMRIAFEKPTIIVTDDLTPFSFDISPVKHLIYPSSLRFKSINKFTREVASAITATVSQSQDPSYRGYLQQFGPIEISELGTQLISSERIVEDLQEIRRSIRALETKSSTPQKMARVTQDIGPHFIRLDKIAADQHIPLSREVQLLPQVDTVRISQLAGDMYLAVTPDIGAGYTRADVADAARPIWTRFLEG